MHERVDAVKEGHEPRVVLDKVMLKVGLLDGEEEAEKRRVLELEDVHAVVLGDLHDADLGG